MNFREEVKTHAHVSLRCKSSMQSLLGQDSMER